MEPASAAVGRPGCPKRMVFGPCGGVRDDERCEMAEHRCVFVDAPLTTWPEVVRPRPVPPDGLLARAAAGPVVLADLSVRPFDPASVRRVVGVLAGASDALLVGEHANRPDFPPTMVAAEVMEAGGRIWTTLACRDRNRVVLEQELAGLAAIGVDGVLCVTGDGRGLSARPGVTQVFDLDGTRLAALAAQIGLPVAVPESPEAPPVVLRPARVAQKERAGAQMCVLNHASTHARVAEFVTAARDAGATVPFVAGVAVYTDEPSARVLQRFPGLRLDAGTGVGGPAGWLAAERRARPVCAEPMVAAVRASHRLFGLPSVVAVAQQLPFADAAFDAAWCLGVLCTTPDKAGALGELRRTMTDGGRLGLLVFVADAPLPPPLPEGNEFPSEEELRRLLDDAGFRLTEIADADLADSSDDWTRRADAVEVEVARRHGSDPSFQQAEEQSRRVGGLLSDGALRAWLGIAVATAP